MVIAGISTSRLLQLSQRQTDLYLTGAPHHSLAARYCHYYPRLPSQAHLLNLGVFCFHLSLSIFVCLHCISAKRAIMKRSQTIDCFSPIIDYVPSIQWRDGTSEDPLFNSYQGGGTFRLSTDKDAKASLKVGSICPSCFKLGTYQAFMSLVQWNWGYVSSFHVQSPFHANWSSK